MPNQQLIDYIKQAQAAGQSKEQIRSALLGAGWQGKDVDDALSGAVFPAQSVTPGASHPSKLIIIAVSLAAVLFIAGGGFAYWYFAYEPKQEVIQTQITQQEKQQIVESETQQVISVEKPAQDEPIDFQYINTKFGYQIKYKSPWRIATDYSRRLATEAQLNEIPTNVLEECPTNPVCSGRLDPLLRDFQLKWSVDASEVIILTDLSEDDEKLFLNEVSTGKKELPEYPRGHWIQVALSDIRSDPSYFKDSPLDSKSRIKIKHITLSNGREVKQVDARLPENPLSAISISMPHDFNTDFQNSVTDGKRAVSLIFITSAENGSDAEKIFFEIVNSTVFD